MDKVDITKGVEEMNIYDKAHELAKAMKETAEFAELKQAKQSIEADPEAKRMLQDFRTQQVELQEKMMAGEMPPQEEMEKAEKLFQILNMNPIINSMFDAERRLSVMMQDINRIITEPLEEIY